MKLNEIVNQDYERETIRDLMLGSEISEYEYSIDDDLVITVTEGIQLNSRWVNNGKLRYKFKHVNGTFDADRLGLTTLENFPEIVRGSLNISSNNISSLEFISKNIMGNLSLDGTPIISLEGISDFIDELKGPFFANFDKIKSGGLGLVLIKRLVSLRHWTTMSTPLPEPFQIIQKYLGKSNDIFDCQNELIEAGFEEYAKL